MSGDEATLDADFVVVGGGPAGLALALMLVRSGTSVVVVEKAKSFDRQYRGEILQPGAMALLDELGIFQALRKRGGYELARFQLVDHGKVQMNVDYRQLPKPYDFLLSLPQRHILEELHTACIGYDGFRQVSGSTVRKLVRDGDRVTGVQCGSGDNERIVRARCVIAADGRYSRMRKLAGIDYHRHEAFEHDVLWFKLPAEGRSMHDVRVFRDAGSPLLLHDSFPDRLQVGWTIPHRSYSDLAARGVAHVKNAIAAAAPPYADLVQRHVNALTDLTLLDVFAGTADRWVDDGILFIGDAAHTHGPIGAQGINLAIQDAAVAHEVLVSALHRNDFSRTGLQRFETRRRPAVERVMALQERQAKGMLASGPVINAIRPVATRLLAHTPVFRKVLEQIAFGDRSVRVHSELFRTTAAPGACRRGDAMTEAGSDTSEGRGTA